GIGVADLRAAAASAAAIELACRHAREPVVGDAPGLRRFRTGVLALRVLRPREAIGLAEAHVEGAAVGGLVGDGAFQDEIAVLILVESQLDEGTDPASALGRAIDDGVLDGVAERIFGHRRSRGTGTLVAPLEAVVVVIIVLASRFVAILAAVARARAVAVPQERDEVARRRE